MRFNPVCIGVYNGSRNTYWKWSEELKRRLDESELSVFFNAKYDLHVLRAWGYSLPKRVWCVQVAEYLLERQAKPYPSLEETAAKYGIGRKYDKIKEYWDKGVQTSEIPRDELDEYVLQDVELTRQIYLKQQQQIKSHQHALFRLQMADLLCLEEIEWNGMKYDRHGIEEKSKQIEADISQIQSQLSIYHSVPNFNWNSSDHLSALLFGGTIQERVKVPDGFYKTGKRAGEVKFKYEMVEHHLPRKFTPKKQTETGKYSVDEDALRSLGSSDLLSGILKIKELEKLNSTYFAGLLRKVENFNFEPNYIHSAFNQVVTVTGRLSSSKPNLQNKPEALDEFIVTRFQ